MSDDRSRFGSHPIRTLPPAERMTAGQQYAPRIELVVGRDGYSGGMSITAYLVTEDGRAKATPLFSHRWSQAPQSYEECLQVAYRGLLAFFEESGILPL